MILELKQCNDSKKFESTCTEHPRIKHLQPHSVFIFPLILSFHPSLTLLLHTPYSLILSLILVDCHTSCFCQRTQQLSTNLHQAAKSEPFSTHDCRQIHLSAYLLGHLSATAVCNCYHSPSDCIGPATFLLQTLLYLLWLLLFSLFVCLYCYLSAFIMLMLNVCCSLAACTSYTSLLLLLNHFADAMQIAVHSLMMKNYSRAYSMSGQCCCGYISLVSGLLSIHHKSLLLLTGAS